MILHSYTILKACASNITAFAYRQTTKAPIANSYALLCFNRNFSLHNLTILLVDAQNFFRPRCKVLIAKLLAGK